MTLPTARSVVACKTSTRPRYLLPRKTSERMAGPQSVVATQRNFDHVVAIYGQHLAPQPRRNAVDRHVLVQPVALEHQVGRGQLRGQLNAPLLEPFDFSLGLMNLIGQLHGTVELLVAFGLRRANLAAQALDFGGQPGQVLLRRVQSRYGRFVFDQQCITLFDQFFALRGQLLAFGFELGQGLLAGVHFAFELYLELVAAPPRAQ